MYDSLCSPDPITHVVSVLVNTCQTVMDWCIGNAFLADTTFQLLTCFDMGTRLLSRPDALKTNVVPFSHIRTGQTEMQMSPNVKWTGPSTRIVRPLIHSFSNKFCCQKQSIALPCVPKISLSSDRSVSSSQTDPFNYPIVHFEKSHKKIKQSRFDG